MATLAMRVIASAGCKTEVLGNFRTWSEPRLVAAAKNGHGGAFGELCERHAERIFRAACRITRHREDAEDAVQDSFLSAFTHIRDFDERSRFSTWLTRIAINAALAKLRKKRGIREDSIDESDSAHESGVHFEVPDSGPDPEEAYRLREREQVIHAAVSSLRPSSRKVVEFHRLQEYSIKETAELLGISSEAAKARMFHARAALRRVLLPKSLPRTDWANTG